MKNRLIKAFRLPENAMRHSEPLGEESQSKQQDSSPALQVQNDGKTLTLTCF